MVARSLHDGGPGIPAAVRLRLFDELPPFASVDSSGSGIGLALVKRICEYLGAALNVNDRPGGGTAFTIAFPAQFTKS